MILVFGSIILDLFFELDTFPKADTALHVASHRIAPGGKGANQALACCRAGAEVRFFGAVGQDVHGRLVCDAMGADGLDMSRVIRSDLPTGLATIFVDQNDGTHRAVVSQGANASAIQSTISEADLQAASYFLAQGELRVEETQALLKRSKLAGLRTVVNLAPVCDLAPSSLSDIDVLVLNEHEAREFAQKFALPYQTESTFIAEVFRRFGMTLVVTLGAGGVVFNDGDLILKGNALSVKAVDTLGAGDAFTAYLTAGLDRGHSMREAVCQATVAGALTCTQYGAQAAQPTLAEVQLRQPEIWLLPLP